MWMLDLFCGRGGWTDAFLARGWKVTGIDLVAHPDYRGRFIQGDILALEHIPGTWIAQGYDFICASSPCEQFSVHGMKHFHPDPPYPELGIKLFEHTRAICEASGAPYVMENVRAAQAFVGRAAHHCGPFYLWGSGVPPLMPQGIKKCYSQSGISRMRGDAYRALTIVERREIRDEYNSLGRRRNDPSRLRAEEAGRTATIPPELANCVVDYAERIVGQVEMAV